VFLSAWQDEVMIEPVKKPIPGVHADEGVMYKFGDLGYVSVFADGHIKFVAYPPPDGMKITHYVNHSNLPGAQAMEVK
jgi:hypothetical protein